MKEPSRIAIIGAGASGTIAAIHLLRKLKTEAKIYMLNKQKETVYKGAAYSSRLEYEPLNVPAGKMSIFNDEPADFFQWLQINKQNESATAVTKESFVSRRWFGEYINRRIETEIERAKNVKFELTIGTVENIDYNTGKNCYEVFSNAGKSIFADYIIFATGNEAPSEIFSKNEISFLGNRYIANPWTCKPFDGLKPDADVLFIGTGLTMVDHVVSLNHRNHVGNIYGVSRHGYLPLPHSEFSNYEFDISAIQNTDLTNIFLQIRKHISKAGAAQINWQSVLDSLREATPLIWNSLDYESKRIFLKRLKPFWEIHRHRVPADSMAVIERMKQNNVLHIISGSIVKIMPGKEKIVFTYLSKSDKKEKQIAIDRIINCTGPSENGFLNTNTLFKNLLAKGWMCRDEVVPGIKTGMSGEIIQQNMLPLKNTYAIGPIRKPAEWETTAVPEIRTQAEKLAVTLAHELKQKMVLTI